MELFKASNQWSSRPNDERFRTLEDLRAATFAYRKSAREANLKMSDLVASTDVPGTEVLIEGHERIPSRLTHWAFGQLAQRVQAPAAYLRTLPASLAAVNLNHGLRQATGDVASILFHQNGNLIARAITSDRYTRIWNFEVADRLIPFVEYGWTTPPAMTDDAKPSGIYASDHDMFVFLVNERNRIESPGNDQGLARGFFVENSEVGASALKITTFYYQYVCGNHIVWGASNVVETALRHVGDKEFKTGQFVAAVRRYADSSASDDEARIATAAEFELGKSKDDVLDAIFGKKIMSRKQAEEAFDTASGLGYVLNPRSAWGMAQGITEMAKSNPFADRRVELDRAAGRVIEMAF